ncbi:MAG: hypothetical protein IBX55_00765 [Methyloprofundus sp.]|nr:hypothetical protein [Methyloprofundus sp.]
MLDTVSYDDWSASATSAGIALIVLGADPEAQCANGDKLIHRIFYQKHFDAAKRLVGMGIKLDDLDHRGSSVLHRVLKGSTRAIEMIEFLYEAGLDLDIKSERGWTALQVEASGGRDEIGITKKLLDLGASIDPAPSNGSDPISLAKSRGKLNVVKILNDEIKKREEIILNDYENEIYQELSGASKMPSLECPGILIINLAF